MEDEKFPAEKGEKGEKCIFCTRLPKSFPKRQGMFENSRYSNDI